MFATHDSSGFRAIEALPVKQAMYASLFIAAERLDTVCACSKKTYVD